MTKYITVKLTEDQARELRELVRFKRMHVAQDIVDSANPGQFSEELAYIKRLETTLVSQMTKS